MKTTYILQIRYGNKWIDNKEHDDLVRIILEKDALLRTRQAEARIIKRTDELIKP